MTFLMTNFCHVEQFNKKNRQKSFLFLIVYGQWYHKHYGKNIMSKKS